MDEAEQLLAKMRQMADSAYRAGDRSAVASLPSEALRIQFRGILLGAAREVDLDAGQRVSGLALIGRSKARSEEISWRDNAIVVAADIERGVVRTAGAFDIDTGKEGEPPRGKPRAPTVEPVRSAAEKARLEALGDGDTAGFVWLDVGQLLKLPREPARYVIRVLYFDQVSNPAVVNVRAKTSQPAAEPLAAATVQARMAVVAQAAAHGLPRYGRSPLTPVIDGPGVALNLGAPGVVAGARQLPAHGVLKLELLPQMIVSAAPGSGAPAPAASPKPPSALVRATVLVLMKDQTQAMRLPLEIPVWSDRALRAGEVVEAAFSVDLAAVLPATPPAGVYQVYLLSGQYLSGPYALTL